MAILSHSLGGLHTEATRKARGACALRGSPGTSSCLSGLQQPGPRMSGPDSRCRRDGSPQSQAGRPRRAVGCTGPGRGLGLWGGCVCNASLSEGPSPSEPSRPPRPHGPPGALCQLTFQRLPHPSLGGPAQPATEMRPAHGGQGAPAAPPSLPGPVRAAPPWGPRERLAAPWAHLRGSQPALPAGQRWAGSWEEIRPWKVVGTSSTSPWTCLLEGGCCGEGSFLQAQDPLLCRLCSALVPALPSCGGRSVTSGRAFCGGPLAAAG